METARRQSRRFCIDQTNSAYVEPTATEFGLGESDCRYSSGRFLYGIIAPRRNRVDSRRCTRAERAGRLASLGGRTPQHRPGTVLAPGGLSICLRGRRELRAMIQVFILQRLR